MVLFFRISQIILNAIAITAALTIGTFIDTQMIFGLFLLVNACISIAIIFSETAKKNDRIFAVFNTLLLFLVAQIYTAISGIITSKCLADYAYKIVCFCLNAIMMGVTFNAFKRYDETNQD